MELPLTLLKNWAKLDLRETVKTYKEELEAGKGEKKKRVSRDKKSKQMKQKEVASSRKRKSMGFVVRWKILRSH